MSDRLKAPEVLARIGGTLLPLTTATRGSSRDAQLHARAGIAVLVMIISSIGAAVVAVVGVLGSGERPDLLTLTSASLLALVSVLAPPVTFRTRSASLTEEVLSDPLARPRSWRSTTLTFEPVLVGAMLAGLSYGPALTGVTFGAALVLRGVIDARRHHREDVNASFHALRRFWSSAVTAAAAYAVVFVLRDSVTMNLSPWPLVLAAFIAASLSLVLNSADRWVDGVHEPWAFARDFIDTRRLIVMIVSAAIAWLAAYTLSLGTIIEPRSAEFAGQVAAIGVFIATWLVLLFASIRLWRRDALRTLSRWSRHQSDILGRIADGSLDPDLARQASLAVTSRMALSVFGATRALVAVHRPDGSVVRHLAVADTYAQPATTDYYDLTDLPSLRIPLYPIPGHRDSSDITIAGFLGQSRFIARSLGLMERFQHLAASAILTPVVASDDDRIAVAFESLFDRDLWHTMESFERAFEVMRERADASPQSHSVLIGVFSIDDFGALEGGRFEHAAIAQVIRLVQGYSGFTGHESFLAYQPEGRVWVCFGSGPLIRNGIGLLRDLQGQINDSGSVVSTHSDLGVHIGVSLGYSVHQVDDFAYDGLIEHATQRLVVDQSTRNPFAVDDLITVDITPEAITGGAPPLVATDLVSRVRDSADSDLDRDFALSLKPIVHPNGGLAAINAEVGWTGSPDHPGLADSRSFLAMVNRRPDLAAEAARAILQRVRPTLTDIGREIDADARLLVRLPSLLLHPDTGVLALPNIVSPFLNRVECARLVVVFDTIPTGGGEALRLLSDRGVGVAMTAGAAATADSRDLDGWSRWAILLPEGMILGDNGIDRLTLQQTVAAIASLQTRLIAETHRPVSAQSLADHGIRLILREDIFADTLTSLRRELPTDLLTT